MHKRRVLRLVRVATVAMVLFLYMLAVPAGGVPAYESPCRMQVADVVPASAGTEATEETLNLAAEQLTGLAASLGPTVRYDFTDEAPVTRYRSFSKDPAYTVVLDPGSSEAVPTVAQAVALLRLPVPVSVLVSCATTQQLQATREQLETMTLPDAVHSMEIRISAAVGLVSVAVDDPNFAETLRAEFGSRVQVDVLAVSLTDRVADDAPHYGGARIWPGVCLQHSLDWCVNNGYGWCSSGITIVAYGSGNVFQTTAGHCGRNTWNYYSGDTNGSPQYHMGQVFTNHINDNPDGFNTDILAYDGATTYRNRFYADPEQYSRTVGGGSNAEDGTFVCQSGVSSRQVCGIRVRDPNTSLRNLPTMFGRVDINHLSKGWRDDLDLIVMGGDSGGPVYHRNGDTDAIIRGSVSAREPSINRSCADVARFNQTTTDCPIIFWTNIDWIESTLDAHVSTVYP